MRNLLALCCYLLFLCACQSENTNTTTTSTTAATTKKDACAYLERGTMSEILGWNHGGVHESLIESATTGKQTICSYKHKEEVLRVRLLWETANADKLTLAEKYSKYLTEGNEGIAYRVVKADDNSQTIFGMEKTAENQYLYVTRRRVGTDTDIELTLSSPKDAAAEFRTRLARLAYAMQL